MDDRVSNFDQWTLWSVCVGLSAVLCAAAAGQGILDERVRWRLIRVDPSALLNVSSGWRVLPALAVIVGIALILLTFVQFATVADGADWGSRIRWLGLAAAVIGSSVAAFFVLNRHWSRGLGDVAAGLLTAGICALAVAFAPTGSPEWSYRFPVHFSTILLALAVLIGFWNWIHGVWEQQLDGGEPWTTAGRLRSMCSRFAYSTGLVGLSVGLILAAWPRLRGIPGRDASLGRVLFGVAAHLLLVLVLMRSWRRWRRTTFAVLAAMVSLSLVFFIVARAVDFVSLSR